MKIIKIRYAALAAGLLLAGASVPPLAHALSQRQTVRQVASFVPLSQMRQQAFQVGMIDFECSSQATTYISIVSEISSLPEPIEVNAETIHWSQETPAIRAAQKQRYVSIGQMLHQMGAPLSVSDWYEHTLPLRLSKPLPSTSAIKAQAKLLHSTGSTYTAARNDNYLPATESEVETDLAEVAEMKDVNAQAVAQKTKVDAWLKEVGPETAWDAQLGSYTAEMHFKMGRVPVSELVSRGNFLLQNIPLETPDVVRQNLSTLVAHLSSPHPDSPAGFITLMPGNAVVQQINQACERLESTYSPARIQQVPSGQ